MSQSKVDIGLFLTPDGYYDLTIASDGDLTDTLGFDTAILMSLFTDTRADPSEVAFCQNRRGWLGNIFQFDDGFQLGSKLWLTDQMRLTNDTANLIQTYASTALQWMIDDGYVDNIETNTILLSSNITLNIIFIRDASIVDSKSFEIWQNTGASFNG
jgi:phage gp46-like protein